MMIYQDGTHLAFAVADLYGQRFAVGDDFKAEDYHVDMHYGINYLLAVGDNMTEVHFDCPQLRGLTDRQLLAVLIDRVTRLEGTAKNPYAQFHLQQAMEHLEQVDCILRNSDGNP